MMKMKPITKLFLLCATLLTLFVSTIVTIDKAFKRIKISSDNAAIYNDSILTIKEEFNNYLIYDDNTNINLMDKSAYIDNSIRKLDSINYYVNSKEIDSIARKKEFYIKSLVMKKYKVKESYGMIKYETTKGVWIFRKTSVKKIFYKKIDKKEIDNLNKTELLNKNAVYNYNSNNDKLNIRLNEIVLDKIESIKREKDTLLKFNEVQTKNTFTILLIFFLISILIIASLLLSIIKDIKHIMIKNNLDKFTLSFLVNYIKENKS